MSILISRSYIILNDFDKENIFKKIIFNFNLNKLNGFDYTNINRKEFFFSKIGNIENNTTLGKEIAKLESILNMNDSIISKMVNVFKFNIDIRTYNTLFECYISKIGIGYWIDALNYKKFKDISHRELIEQEVNNNLKNEEYLHTERISNLEDKNLYSFNYDDIHFKKNENYIQKYSNNVITYELEKENNFDNLDCSAYNIIFPSSNSEDWRLKNENSEYTEDILNVSNELNDEKNFKKSVKDIYDSFKNDDSLKNKLISSKNKIKLRKNKNK